MSSLRRGHANLLCIVPIFADDLVRGSTCPPPPAIYRAVPSVGFSLWLPPRRRRRRFFGPKTVGAVRELNPRPLAPKARIIPLDQQPVGTKRLKNMLDGIRTRNPQIRSLMRYPLRHEHLTLVRAAPTCGNGAPKWAKNGRKTSDNREIRTPAEFLPSDF